MYNYLWGEKKNRKGDTGQEDEGRRDAGATANDASSLKRVNLKVVGGVKSRAKNLSMDMREEQIWGKRLVASAPPTRTHPDFLLSGYLHKQRKWLSGQWAERYFLLTRTSLYYFKRHDHDEMFGELKAKLNLEDFVLLPIPNTPMFQIKSKSGIMLVRAANSRQCDLWCDCIMEARQAKALEKMNGSHARDDKATILAGGSVEASLGGVGGVGGGSEHAEVYFHHSGASDSARPVLTEESIAASSASASSNSAASAVASAPAASTSSSASSADVEAHVQLSDDAHALSNSHSQEAYGVGLREVGFTNAAKFQQHDAFNFTSQNLISREWKLENKSTVIAVVTVKNEDGEHVIAKNVGWGKEVHVAPVQPGSVLTIIFGDGGQVVLDIDLLSQSGNAADYFSVQGSLYDAFLHLMWTVAPYKQAAHLSLSGDGARQCGDMEEDSIYHSLTSARLQQPGAANETPRKRGHTSATSLNSPSSPKSVTLSSRDSSVDNNSSLMAKTLTFLVNSQDSLEVLSAVFFIAFVYDYYYFYSQVDLFSAMMRLSNPLSTRASSASVASPATLASALDTGEFSIWRTDLITVIAFSLSLVVFLRSLSASTRLLMTAREAYVRKPDAAAVRMERCDGKEADGEGEDDDEDAIAARTERKRVIDRLVGSVGIFYRSYTFMFLRMVETQSFVPMRSITSPDNTPLSARMSRQCPDCDNGYDGKEKEEYILDSKKIPSVVDVAVPLKSSVGLYGNATQGTAKKRRASATRRQEPLAMTEEGRIIGPKVECSWGAWTQADYRVLKIRGPTYLTSRVKVRAKRPKFTCVHLDIYACRQAISCLAAQKHSYFDQMYERAQRSGRGHLWESGTCLKYFIVNFMVPGSTNYNFVMYFRNNRFFKNEDKRIFNAKIQEGAAPDWDRIFPQASSSSSSSSSSTSTSSPQSSSSSLSSSVLPSSSPTSASATRVPLPTSEGAGKPSSRAPSPVVQRRVYGEQTRQNNSDAQNPSAGMDMGSFPSAEKNSKAVRKNAAQDDGQKQYNSNTAIFQGNHFSPDICDGEEYGFYDDEDDENDANDDDDEHFQRLLQKFVNGDDDFRRSRFKFIPNVVESSWIVKSACGNVPCLIGKKIKSDFYTDANKQYIEAVVDVSTSSVAGSILNLVKGYAKSLVLEMHWLLEPQEQDELPECLLGGMRLVNVDLHKASKHPFVDDADDTSYSEDVGYDSD